MESPFQKVKNRTEWQAYLVSLIVLFVNQFLGLDIDPETLWQMVGLSGAYGASRGLAKMKVGVAPVQGGEFAVSAPAPAAGEAQGAGSDTEDSN